METTVKKLKFSFAGKFVTDLARDRFLKEGAPYQDIKKLLLETLGNAPCTDSEKARFAQDVLLGRGEFVGDTATDDFGYRETEEFPDTVFLLIDKLRKELDAVKKDRDEIQDVYLDLAEAVGEGRSLRVCRFARNRELNRFVSPYEKYVAPPTESDDVEDEDAPEPLPEYGLINPDGEFIPIKWARHTEWAIQYVDEHDMYTAFREWAKLDENNLHNQLDYLIMHLGWILLHSPLQNKAFVTQSETITPNKKQLDALYVYYVERKRYDDAKSIYPAPEL